MSAFKEMIAKDNTKVFLDLEYFADLHLIEGKETVVSVDSDVLDPKWAEMGLGQSHLVLYGLTADLPKAKQPGQVLNFDNREYTILQWTENKGMTEIHLAQPVSY